MLRKTLRIFRKSKNFVSFSSSKGNNESKPFFQKALLAKKNKISKELKDETKDTLHEAYDAFKKSDSSLSKIDNMRVQDVYKIMDSSIEGFFYKRTYNLVNFNYLLQILSEQKNLEQAVRVFKKMQELNIKPTEVTYNILIKACGKVGNIVEAEKYFSDAKKKFGMLSLPTYTTLMYCYARKHQPDQCLSLFNEMKNLKMQPDIPCYTTLINSYYKGRNLNKCWEIYSEVELSGLGNDENILGLMIEICSHSHDAEKAISLFKKLEAINFRETSLPYNAMIKAYASRPDYAAKGVELYHTMLAKGVIPDQDTYVAALKACSNVGDVKSAYDIILMMRHQKFEITKYIYNEMIRTYAGALNHEFLTNEVKDAYILDAWKIFEKIKEENKVSIQILNSLLLVHCRALKPDQVEGLVLPLYEQYEIKRDQFTYQNMLKLFTDLRDIDKTYRVYDLHKKEGVTPSFHSMNYYLETAMRMQDTKRIIEALQDFKKQKMEPKTLYLKRLGEAENIPESVHVELAEFKLKFGFIADKVYRIAKPNKYSPM